MEHLHPLRVMSRTDSDLNPMLHSFFLIRHDGRELAVDHRHPPNRKNIDVVEEGLLGLVTEFFDMTTVSTCITSCVLTNHEGRYYVCMHKSRHAVIALVSAFTMPSVCRSLLNLCEQHTNIALYLLCICCDLPIQPLPKLQYTLLIQDKPIFINFSSLEYVQDKDIDVCVQHAFTPNMMVKAWEAILTETRLLLISTHAELLVPCCDFVRRLCHPMAYIYSYIPVLPEAYIEAVEAPGMYLYGARLSARQIPALALHNVLVLDLDCQCVYEYNLLISHKAPAHIQHTLMHSVRQMVLNPLGAFVARASDLAHFDRHPQAQDSAYRPSYNAPHIIVDHILGLFSQVNTLLLSAQLCSIKAFVRHGRFVPSVQAQRCFRGLEQAREIVAGSPDISFTKLFDICVGCLQRWVDPHGTTAKSGHLTQPCWLELDLQALAVYLYADDLPLVVVRTEEMEAVMGCALEPDGYVFEIQLRNQDVHRFTTTDKTSRQLWISMLEERIQQRQLSLVGGASSSHQLNFSSDVPPPPPPVASGSAGGGAGAEGVLPGEGNATDASMYLFRQQMPVSTVGREPSDLSDPEALCDLFRFRDVVRSSQLYIYICTECDHMQFTKGGLGYIRREQGGVFIDGEQRSVMIASGSLISAAQERRLKPYLHKIARTQDICDQMRQQTVLEDPAAGAITPKKSMRRTLSDVTSISTIPEEEDEPAPHTPLHRGATQEEQQGLAALSSAHRRCVADINYQVVMDRLEALETYFDPTCSAASSSQDRSSLVFREIVYDLSAMVNNLAKRVDDGSGSSVSPHSPVSPLVSPGAPPLFGQLSRQTSTNLRLMSALAHMFSDEKPQDKASSLGAPTQANPHPHTHPHGLADESQGLYAQLIKLASTMPVYSPPSRFQYDEDAEDDFLHAEERDPVQAMAREEIRAHVDSLAARAPVCLGPAVQTLSAFAAHYSGDPERALTHYAASRLAPPQHIAVCMLYVFCLHIQSAFAPRGRSDDSSLDPVDFVCRCHDMNPLLGMQAYRLVLECTHEQQAERLERLGGIAEGLRCFRSLPRSGLTVGSTERRSVSKSGLLRAAQDFTFTDGDEKSEVLNEVYICTKLECAPHPVALSVSLLERLREVLRSCAQTSSAGMHCVRADGLCKMLLRADLIHDLQALSAFKKFEVDSCQLQKADLQWLSNNERLIFFSNVYNALQIHSVVKLFEAFQRPKDQVAMGHLARYNLGGLTFSLLDIKEGVLRNASSGPNMFSPFSSGLRFSASDPRRALMLSSPKPGLAFCLVTGLEQSPELAVLREPDDLDKEIAIHTHNYLLAHVRYDVARRTVNLPALCRAVWTDLGVKKQDLLQHLCSVAGGEVRERMKAFVEAVGNKRIRVAFDAADSQPAFVFHESQ